MKANDFWTKVNLLQRKGMRIGQAVFSIAEDNLDSRMVEKICDDGIDPFYDDSMVKEFVERLGLEY